MKILIIQTAFIGDAILATALIAGAKEKHPHATIDLLVRKGNESLFENDTDLNKVLVWNKKNNKYKNLWFIWKQIRASKYDLLLNLQRFGSSGFLSAFSKAKDIRGFKKNPFSFFFTHSYTHDLGEGKHEVDRNLSLLESDRSFLPRLFFNDDIVKKVDPLTTKSYVCIAPASVWFTKQFPRERWVELLNQIPIDYRVYVLGAPSDTALGDWLIQKNTTHDLVNLCGQLSLLESAFLMKKSKLSIVNDSAPMHLASAVNAPTMAIFCSTVPSFGFGPLSSISAILEVDKPLDCRPCGLHGYKACPQKHFKCAHDIDLKSVSKLF